MEKTIAVLGGDRRMALLARLLAEDGHPVRTWGLAAFGMEDTALEEAAQADRVVLPVPLSRGKNLNCTAAALPLCGLFALLRPEQRLYAGGVKAADREAAAEFGLTLTDYLSREELAVRNGVPTAEGAIEAAMAATDVTLCGTPCLVIGFGRIGKLLAHRLRGLGAEVTVSARRLDDLAWIDAFGYRGLRTNRLAGRLGSFRVVFNTVPNMVLTEELLRELPRECVLLELASQPGFDRAAAEARARLRLRARTARQGRAGDRSARHQADLGKNMGGRSMRTERIGFALCGSFCNHPKILMLFEEMAESFEMVPILSENTARYDTRFGLADDLIARVERAAGRPAIRTIVEAEPFGPQNLADVLVIAPCTGNTLAKLAHGITDGPVTMAAKSHLRNGKPVVVALATNDGLSASAPNLAALLNRKNYYFVPFGQDDPQGKPTSLIADFSQLVPTIDAALRGVQLQPLLVK